jgi:hypothetical protein
MLDINVVDNLLVMFIRDFIELFEDLLRKTFFTEFIDGVVGVRVGDLFCFFVIDLLEDMSKRGEFKVWMLCGWNLLGFHLNFKYYNKNGKFKIIMFRELI